MEGSEKMRDTCTSTTFIEMRNEQRDFELNKDMDENCYLIKEELENCEVPETFIKHEANVDQYSSIGVTVYVKEDNDIKLETQDDEFENKVENVRLVDKKQTIEIVEKVMDESSGKPLYKCGKCDSVYKDRQGLKRHVQGVHEGVIYACNKCDFKSRHQSNLKIHIRSIHNGVGFKCAQCDHVAGTKGHLKRHEKIHNACPRTPNVPDKDGLFKCVDCSASFTFNTSLLRHIRNKHEGVTYSCDQCEYQATIQSVLRTHKQAMHQGVKHSCNQCEYQAKDKSNLRRHKHSVHDGVKYSCDQCEFEATDRGYLAHHKKVKHEGVKYLCDQCKYQATSKSHLKRHMKTKHLRN